MISYPLTFKVSSTASSGIQKNWRSSADAQPHITCAIPKSFKGSGDGYSPEDMCAMAALNCFVATFKVFAERSGVEFEEMEATCTLTVDRAEGGVPSVKNLDMIFNLKGVKDKDKAQKILNETSKSCIVGNAIKGEKTYQFNFI